MHGRQRGGSRNYGTSESSAFSKSQFLALPVLSSVTPCPLDVASLPHLISRMMAPLLGTHQDVANHQLIFRPHIPIALVIIAPTRRGTQHSIFPIKAYFPQFCALLFPTHLIWRA